MRHSGDKATRTHDQEPHQARQMAESFGSDPERYDRARPRYPEAMVARIAAASPGPEFLDVGRDWHREPTVPGGVYRRVVPDWPLNPWTRPGLDAFAPILQRTAEGIRTTGAFTGPEQWRFDWERSYTRDEWLEQMATGGDARQFPPAQLEALLASTGVAIDAWGGKFTMQYAAVVLSARINPT